MNSPISRKAFLLRSTLTLAATGLAVPPLLAQSPAPSAAPSVPDRGPQIESALVKDFVIAGHANLDKVKEMLAAQPALINAAWDWGGGDFETALGGASHMGRPDIAEFQLSKNARMDLLPRRCSAKSTLSVRPLRPFLRSSPSPVRIRFRFSPMRKKEVSLPQRWRNSCDRW